MLYEDGLERLVLVRNVIKLKIWQRPTLINWCLSFFDVLCVNALPNLVLLQHDDSTTYHKHLIIRAARFEYPFANKFIFNILLKSFYRIIFGCSLFNKLVQVFEDIVLVHQHVLVLHIRLTLKHLLYELLQIRLETVPLLHNVFH